MTKLLLLKPNGPIYYQPHTEYVEGYVFTGTCLSMGGLPLEGVCMKGNCMEGADPPRYGKLAVGTYPTGMHSYCGPSYRYA